MSLINCEIELDLKWKKSCVISEISRTFRAFTNADPVAYEAVTATTEATFQINNAKPYVAVVTLSINDNIKQGFKIKDLKEEFLGTNIYLK